MEAVGRLAGVSQVTVSRALSDPTKVSPATMQRIREAIALTGFVPNALAGALASRKSKLITALVPSITNIVYASMAKAFADRMREKGYQIVLSESGFDPAEEEKLVMAHLSRRPDAILLTGIHHTATTRRMLLGAGIPVVEVWDITDTPIDLCVGFSHVEAGRSVARFAVRSGYERAATVSAGDERALRRKAAFKNEFLREVPAAPVTEIDFDGGASLARGREGLTRLVGAGFREGVVFCSSDLLAHGVLIEAQARGLSVPKDVAVVGFGDQDFAAHTHPTLTSVRVDRSLLGQTAAEAIISRLTKGNLSAAATDVGFTIIRRESA